jgi:prepilin-type N-terminal cleavage/methylation domain-containing protein
MRNRGFTLIEIVVAMAILGIGLVVIIELFSGGLRLGRASEEYSKAAGYARMKLEEVMVSQLTGEGIQPPAERKNHRLQAGGRALSNSFQRPLAVGNERKVHGLSVLQNLEIAVRRTQRVKWFDGKAI